MCGSLVRRRVLGCSRRRRLGALVASSLVGQGAQARLAIGSTNAAEFLVTVTISATFVMTIGLELWPIIVGLIVGGVVAAPFAAYVTRRLPVRVLMVLVGSCDHPPQHAGDDSPVSSRVAHIRRFGFPVERTSFALLSVEQ